MHQVLNQFHVFGRLLFALALSAKAGDVHAVRLFPLLLARCRTTHEAYATFTSVSLARLSPKDALASYPGYEAYYEAAAALTGPLDPSKNVVAYHLVDAALGECMDAPFRPSFIRSCFSQLRLRDLPRLYEPDNRFRLLRSVVPSLVPRLLDGVDTALEDHPGRGQDTSCRHWEHGTISDELERALQAAVSEELRRLLEQSSLPVFSSAEQRHAAVEAIRTELAKAHPHDLAIFDATHRTVRRDAESIGETMVLGERLTFRKTRKSIVVMTDAVEWLNTTRPDEIEAVIIVLASRARMRLQFALAGEELQGSEDEVHRWFFFDIDSNADADQIPVLCSKIPETLDFVLERLPETPITVLVIASNMPDEEAWMAWNEHNFETDVVLYCDLNVFRVVARELRSGRSVKYTAFRPEENERLFCLAFDEDIAGFPLLWIGSQIAGRIVIHMLSAVATGKAAMDDTLPVDDAIVDAIRYVITNESETGAFQGSQTTVNVAAQAPAEVIANLRARRRAGDALTSRECALLERYGEVLPRPVE